MLRCGALALRSGAVKEIAPGLWHGTARTTVLGDTANLADVAHLAAVDLRRALCPWRA
jgi:hypothetical protein